MATDNVLPGTMTSQTSASSQKDTEYARKRRESLRRGIIQLTERGFDDNMIRQKAYEKGGFEPGEINSVLSEYKQMRETNFAGTEALKPSQKIQSAEQIGADIDQMELSNDQRLNLGFGRRMKSSDDTISALEDSIAKKNTWEGLKQFIDEKQAGNTLTQRYVPEDFQKFDQAQRDFINAVLRRESGAVISEEEFENARKQYFPKPGDAPSVIEQKRANRQLVTKNFLSGAGVDVNTVAFGKEETEIQQDQKNQKPEEQPEAPAMEQLVNDDGIKYTGFFDFQGFTPEQKEDIAFDTAKGTGEKIGSFTGGNKIGEAIGNAIGGQLARFGEAGKSFQDTLSKYAEMKSNGVIDDQKYETLVDNLEKSAKDAFGYDGPSFKQVAGDVVKSAATVLGGAEVRGATALTTAARTAAAGATYSGGNAAAEDKNPKDIVIDSLIGGAISGAVPLAGAGIKKGYKTIIGKNTPEEALGEILQGKTKDLKAGERALAVIDTKGVKTFEDLYNRLDENISYLSNKVDEVLGKDKSLIPLSELATEAKSKGGKVVKTNFVENALKHLEELYAKTGKSVDAQNVRELIQKAETEGLSKVEINQIARDYGKSNKSFTKFGEQLTSVNAQLYENTRSGLKEVARRGINGEVAKNLDSLVSDSIHTRDLIERNMEAVNRLEQKAAKMGLGEKLFRGATNVADVLSLGAVSGVRKFFQQSNVGNKTMNFLDIESKLEGNLKLLEKAINAKTPGALEEAIRGFNKKMINSVKGKAGLSVQDVSKDETKKIQYFNNGKWQTLDEIAKEIIQVRTEGTKTAKIVGEEGISKDKALDMAREKVKDLKGRIMSRSGVGKFVKN